jgi:hypothetical protein
MSRRYDARTTIFSPEGKKSQPTTQEAHAAEEKKQHADNTFPGLYCARHTVP